MKNNKRLQVWVTIKNLLKHIYEYSENQKLVLGRVPVQKSLQSKSKRTVKVQLLYYSLVKYRWCQKSHTDNSFIF